MIKPKPINIQAVASFSGEQCLGNQHIVMCFNEEAHFNKCIQSYILPLSQQLPHWIFVLALLEAQKPYVRFYQNARMVQRCGSGSLALAYSLFNKDNAQIDTDSSKLAIFQTVKSKIIIGRKENLFYYQSQSLPYHPPKDNKPWQTLVNQPVQDVVLVGSKTDYLILVLENSKALKRCSLNVRLNSLINRRSIIATATALRGDGVDYYLRYFNPLYGRYEDAATGSANAMLARYWQRNYLLKRVKGQQLSTEGGMFVVESMPLAQQRVLGECQSLSIHADMQAIFKRTFNFG